MMRKFAAFILLAAAMAAWAAAPAAPQFPTHIDIPESDARWQELPEQVIGVTVQDGKRVWYELEHPAQKEDMAVVERVIRDQFDKPSPQLFGARVQLFETGGRVWFRSHSGDTLLSYDGKVFKQYPAAAQGQGHYYVGTCPNTGISHVLYYRNGANCQVGQTVFFAESHGVLCVTGDKPDYHPMTDLEPGARGLNYPVISLEPDGKGVVAHLVIKGQLVLHRWRDGRWKEVPAAGAVSGVVEVAPWPDGAWVIQQNASMFFVNYEGLDDKVLAGMVAELGQKEFKVREKATERLIAIAPQVKDRLDKAMKATDDPEIRFRLEKVLAVAAPKPGISRLMSLELQGPALALCEGEWMYVQALKILENGADRGRGVVLAKANGEYKLFLGAEAYDGFNWMVKPLVVKEHALIWTGVARLFDVEKGQFVLDAPTDRFRWLHAAMSDGTVFLGWSQRSPATPLAVFRPQGK